MSKKNIALDRLTNIQNHISNQPQPTGPIDLARERENVSFNVKRMNWLFWGGKEFAEALQDAFLIIQRDPDLYFPGGHPFDLTRPEEREVTMKQIFKYLQLKKSLKDPLLLKALGVAMGIYSESFNMKVYVNDTLFAQSFQLFSTTEQYETYIDDILNWKVIGCFAMTELGHSSFLRGLETTATYDRETDEFIIHSPTLTSTKIWIGMAGQTATHSIAICQTIIDGKTCGTNWFIVQLRDQKTGKLMPGVTAGDVGAKYGRNGIDNGWIQFSHVRVPRTNMMMRWAKVNKGGEYIPSANPAVSYTVLIGERLSVLSEAIITCGQVLTIACRYGCVRRQGANEEQIMDYQSHYVSLMPCVASTYVIAIVTQMILNKWEGIMKLVQTSQEEFVSYLPDVHAISSGLKATISWWGCEVLERVRRSMGGYAYSSYNAIGIAIKDWGVVTTGGGDNFVLIQQTVRYLLGSFKQVSHGKKVTESVEFLNDIQQILLSTKSILSDERQLLNLDFTLEMYTWLCCKRIDVLATRLDSSATGEETTWNDNQVDLIKLGELYSYRFTLSEYIKGIKEYSTNSEFKGLIPILTKLGSLWAIHLINDSLHLFLEEEYFSKEQVKMIKNYYLKLCKEIRKECIPLVDSWGFPDFILKAPLGKYDGDVYTAYLDTLKAAPNCIGIPDYWEKYVKVLTNPK